MKGYVEKVVQKMVLFMLVCVMVFGIQIQVCQASPLSPKAVECYRVQVASGYLALRNDTAYDPDNEIGELYNYDMVELWDVNSSASDYWRVYSPRYQTYGYVNKNYLVHVSYKGEYKVHVNSGYLALRKEMEYDASNEIGGMDSGETFKVWEKTSSDYWWGYSPELDKWGYVNCNYLY